MTARPPVVLALAAALLAPGAAAEDLHVLWDRQCGGCHGHAGPFARATLDVVDGVLRDKAGRDTAEFLRRHNGGYTADQIAAILGMLRAQTDSGDLFRRKCGECHGTDSELVRGQLVQRYGVLTVRASGRSMAEVMHRHGDLEDAEAAALLDVLDRIDSEVRHR